MNNNTNKRLNTLVSRMFANASENNVQQQVASSSRVDEANANAAIRRNLFGIRLNHEQLKQDLKIMWNDQIERQKREWNFDFENLKPLSSSKQTLNNKNNKCSPIRSSSNKRFEWTRVLTKPSLNEEFASSKTTTSTAGLVLSTFDKNELKKRNNHDEEIYDDDASSEEEEEEDDALAIPTFYKYQRKQKLNQEQNRLKFIRLASINSAAALASNLSRSNSSSSLINSCNETKTTLSENKTAFSKLKQHQPKIVNAKFNNKKLSSRTKNKVINQTPKSSNKKILHKPQAIRSSKNSHVKNNLSSPCSSSGLIITFSENRKDTLRSAAITNTPLTSKIHNPLSNTCVVELAKINNNEKHNKISNVSEELHLSDLNEQINILSKKSAFKSITTPQNSSGTSLKQQSLLEMLQQRKRKNPASSASKLNNSKTSVQFIDSNKASSSHLITHNLRPRTISFN